MESLAWLCKMQRGMPELLYVFCHLQGLSSSYAPEPNTNEYHKYIQELRNLLEVFAPNNSKIVVPNVSVVYWGKL